METIAKTVDKMKAVLETAECLHDFSTIEKALDKMAIEITEKLSESNPIILCVMIGALIPTGHLVTRLHFPLQIDYVHATRYQGAVRSGDLHWIVEPRIELKDRTVLIVDDIMDGGLTLGSIIDYCTNAGAKNVYSAVMINKLRKREPGVNFEPDFSGLDTKDEFLVGFGLDYAQYLRNAPGIYAVAKEHQ